MKLKKCFCIITGLNTKAEGFFRCPLCNNEGVLFPDKYDKLKKIRKIKKLLNKRNLLIDNVVQLEEYKDFSRRSLYKLFIADDQVSLGFDYDLLYKRIKKGLKHKRSKKNAKR